MADKSTEDNSLKIDSRQNHSKLQVNEFPQEMSSSALSTGIRQLAESLEELGSTEIS